ncbi:MAG: hypothetical protein HDR53_02895 [Treponema sp.]|nr:hypothetical protein [Treponema sp.]
MKKVSTFELLKKSFCNEMHLQQACNAKFQAEIAVNKRIFEKIEKTLFQLQWRKVHCSSTFNSSAFASSFVRFAIKTG